MTDFEKVYDFGNLHKAFMEARKGKRGKKAVAKFEANLLENIDLLARQIKSGTFILQPYNEFVVYEPKTRRVKAGAFRDSVLQHSLCDNVLGKILSNSFILDNAAVQKGKGTHFALDRLRSSLRSYFFTAKAKNDKGRREAGLPPLPAHLGNYSSGWVLKADIANYFYSIPHTQLKSILRRRITDDGIWWLVEMIINSTDDPGIPIGNLTSQWFALAYLDGLDHMAKEKLGIKYYGRYMDDFYLIHESKDYLRHCLSEITKYLDGLGLTLNKKTQIFPLRHGIDFCGFRTYLTDTGKVVRKIRKASKEKAKRKLKGQKKRLEAGEITLEDIKTSYTSWKAHAAHGNSYHLLQNTDQRFEKLFKGCEENGATITESTY